MVLKPTKVKKPKIMKIPFGKYDKKAIDAALAMKS